MSAQTSVSHVALHADENDKVHLLGQRAAVDNHGPHATPAAKDPADAQRKLGFFAVAIVLFASVAGGPFGIEVAVGSAGVLPVLLGSLVLAFAWSATQALVAAELSTAFPSNGGYVTWVVEGLGPTLGFINAMNSCVSALCNLPLYPVLFASYVQNLYPNISDGALWAIKLGGVLLTVSLNVAGIEAVTVTSTIFTIIVQTPFILMPIAAAAYGQSFSWNATLSVAPNWQANVSVFVSTLCWNAIGWTNCGNLASEVRNPKRSFPLGAGIAVLLVTLNYVYPVILCSALAPDISQWDTGYFATVGQNVAAWVGDWTTVAAAFSCMNNFQPQGTLLQMSTTSRALRFTALYRMVPLPWLDRNHHRLKTPIAAILLQAALICVLMSFGFDVLVVVNVLFYNCGVALQFAAFLRLRYTRPALERPFTVPGGMAGAWACVLSLFACLAVAFYAAAISAWWGLVAVLGANVAFALGGVAWARWGFVEGRIETIDLVEAQGLDAGDPANAEAVQTAAAAVAAAAAQGIFGTAAVLGYSKRLARSAAEEHAEGLAQPPPPPPQGSRPTASAPVAAAAAAGASKDESSASRLSSALPLGGQTSSSVSLWARSNGSTSRPPPLSHSPSQHGIALPDMAAAPSAPSAPSAPTSGVESRASAATSGSGSHPPLAASAHLSLHVSRSTSDLSSRSPGKRKAPGSGSKAPSLTRCASSGSTAAAGGHRAVSGAATAAADADKLRTALLTPELDEEDAGAHSD